MAAEHKESRRNAGPRTAHGHIIRYVARPDCAPLVVSRPADVLPLPYAGWSAPHRYGFNRVAEQAWKPFAFRELELNRFDSSVFPRYYGGVFNFAQSAVLSSRLMVRGTKAAAANVAADGVKLIYQTIPNYPAREWSDIRKGIKLK